MQTPLSLLAHQPVLLYPLDSSFQFHPSTEAALTKTASDFPIAKSMDAVSPHCIEGFDIVDPSFNHYSKELTIIG